MSAGHRVDETVSTQVGLRSSARCGVQVILDERRPVSRPEPRTAAADMPHCEVAAFTRRPSTQG